MWQHRAFVDDTRLHIGKPFAHTGKLLLPPGNFHRDCESTAGPSNHAAMHRPRVCLNSLANDVGASSAPTIGLSFAEVEEKLKKSWHTVAPWQSFECMKPDASDSVPQRDTAAVKRSASTFLLASDIQKPLSFVGVPVLPPTPLTFGSGNLFCPLCIELRDGCAFHRDPCRLASIGTTSIRETALHEFVDNTGPDDDALVKASDFTFVPLLNDSNMWQSTKITVGWKAISAPPTVRPQPSPKPTLEPPPPMSWAHAPGCHF
eukprot:TRINITY_DN25629_c0_g1_i1.p1 TRINITY_DN25629_c0_g1~~TRINITY_DN25629_c0_g1_i1.p1  ORF type:complete len:261 (+),score=29.88 TRINITY_DN25629_c0_g1_i1:81-863(+)